MELQPLGSRVLARRIKEEKETKGGIVLPESAKDAPSQAEVLAVGSGRKDNGNTIKPEVQEGDRVLFGDFSGTEVEFDGEEYLILEAEDLLARLVD